MHLSVDGTVLPLLNANSGYLTNQSQPGGQNAASASAPAQNTNVGTQQPPAPGQAPADGGLFAGFGSSTIIIYIIFIGALFFLMFWLPKRREKQAAQKRDSLSVGDNVRTTSGMYGVISAITDDCFIVEFGTNKGVRIPIVKSAIEPARAPGMTSTPADKPDKTDS